MIRPDPSRGHVGGERAARYGRGEFLRRAGGAAILLPASGGAFSLLISGCGGGAPSGSGGGGGGEGAESTIRQGYTTALGFIMSFCEAMVAKEEGFWADEGLEVEMQGGQGTASAIQSVLGRSSNYSRAGGVNTIVAIANEDAPLTNIGTIYQRSQFEVVSLADQALRSPEELADRSIGVVSSGGQTENLLDIMLAKAGIPKNSVERPVVGVGAAALELAKNGSVDGWIALDSDRALFESEGEELYSFNTDEYALVPTDSYVTSLPSIEENPDAPRRFLAGLLSAVDFARDEANWDKVIADVKKYNPELNDEAARLELPLLVEKWIAAGEDKVLDMDPAAWEEGQQNLVDADLVAEPVPVEQLIDPSFLDDVKGR